MAITVVGSVAYDTIETPAGKRERCLGGAATYFSLAASFFTDLRVIAVVGEDFGPEQEAVFEARHIDTRGIERAAGTHTITIPIANHDNNQHSSNENIRVQNLWDGIETMAALLAMQ